jgi:hypothetical protein
MAAPFLPYGCQVTPGSTGPGIRQTSDSGQPIGLPTVGGDRTPQQPKEIVMSCIRRIRRLAAALAGLAGALLAFAGAAPAALARTAPPRPPGWNKHPPLPYGHRTGAGYQAPVHTVVTGGTPGWQITLTAVGAALLAATAAVAAYRARAIGRRSHRHRPLSGGDPA